MVISTINLSGLFYTIQQNDKLSELNVINVCL